MKNWLLILLAITPALATAESRPHWAVELKGGVFTPAYPNWALYYDKASTFEGGMYFAYKPMRFFELGVESNYIRDTGKGLLPLNGTTGGEVIYELLPISAQAVLRATFSDKQWVVPYAGVGYTRATYRQSMKNQATVVGSAQGQTYRAGIELLLDVFDYRSAHAIKDQYHVINTLWFVEYRQETLNKNGINLGGNAWLSGILFEY